MSIRSIVAAVAVAWVSVCISLALPAGTAAADAAGSVAAFSNDWEQVFAGSSITVPVPNPATGYAQQITPVLDALTLAPENVWRTGAALTFRANTTGAPTATAKRTRTEVSLSQPVTFAAAASTEFAIQGIAEKVNYGNRVMVFQLQTKTPGASEVTFKGYFQATLKSGKFVYSLRYAMRSGVMGSAESPTTEFLSVAEGATFIYGIRYTRETGIFSLYGSVNGGVETSLGVAFASERAALPHFIFFGVSTQIDMGSVSEPVGDYSQFRFLGVKLFQTPTDTDVDSSSTAEAVASSTGAPESVASSTGAPVSVSSTGPAAPAVPSAACPAVPSGGRLVSVSTAAQLKTALTNAVAGDVISMADGNYVGTFSVTGRSGTADLPITLCGSNSAIVQRADTGGYSLYFNSCNYWRLLNFQVTKGGKNVFFDYSNDNYISGLEMHHPGQEALHFRLNSSRNVVEHCYVHNTGTVDERYGEGMYVGSSKSNYVNDFSNDNVFRFNHIGPNMTAECIDIKEYVTGTIVEFNYFDGTGQTGANGGDSFIDVKGNNNIIRSNTGKNPLIDAYQVHVQVDGWGNDNLFQNNSLDADSDTISGYLVYIKTATGTVVACDNSDAHTTLGLATIPCTESANLPPLPVPSSTAGAVASSSSSSTGSASTTGADASSSSTGSGETLADLSAQLDSIVAAFIAGTMTRAEAEPLINTIKAKADNNYPQGAERSALYQQITASRAIIRGLATLSSSSTGGTSNPSTPGQAIPAPCVTVSPPNATLPSYELFLSPTGSDAIDNPGTSAASPLATLARALAVVKAAKPTGHVFIWLAPGTYSGQQVTWNYVGAASTTVAAIEGATSMPLFDGGGALGTFFLIKGWKTRFSNFRFRNFEITNYWMALDFGSSNEASDGNGGNEITGMRFTRIGEIYGTNASPTYSYACVRMQHSHNNFISGNTWTDIQNTVVYSGYIHALYLAHDTSCNMIRNNVFIRVNGDAVRMRNASNFNTAVGNTFINAGKYAAFSDWFDDEAGANECPGQGHVFANNSVGAQFAFDPPKTYWLADAYSYFQDDFCGTPVYTRIIETGTIHTSSNDTTSSSSGTAEPVIASSSTGASSSTAAAVVPSSSSSSSSSTAASGPVSPYPSNCCQYRFSNPTFPLVNLPSGGDTNVLPGNSIVTQSGQPVQCNGDKLSVWNITKGAFETTYTDNNGRVKEYQHVLYVTNSNQLYKSTIQTQDSKMRDYLLSGKLVQLALTCSGVNSNALNQCVQFSTGSSSAVVDPLWTADRPVCTTPEGDPDDTVFNSSATRTARPFIVQLIGQLIQIAKLW